LTLLLEALDIFLTVHFVLDGSCALLLLEDSLLLSWRVKLDLHLVHFLHRWYDHGGAFSAAHVLLLLACGHTALHHGHLISGVAKHRLRLNGVDMLLVFIHTCVAKLIFLLTQVDLDTALGIAAEVVRVSTLHRRRARLLEVSRAIVARRHHCIGDLRL